MRILLTGASGFIGSHLTARLIETGHSVVAAVRAPQKMARRFPAVHPVLADLNRMGSPADWAPLLAGVDAVVNCAGLLQGGRDGSLEAVHARAPIALFEAARAAGVRKIVQISAVSVGADTDYAKSKRAADDALQAMDVDWTILRPSLVYGRVAYGGTALMRALAAMPLAIPVVGTGAQAFQPIHLDAVADTVLWALERPAARRVIVEPCGPDKWTMAEMVKAYRAWLGLPPAPILRVPRILVALACRAGDVLGSGALRTTSLRQIEFGNAADPEAFRAATGLSPRGLNEMLMREPAGTAELWQARLLLLRPLVTGALVLLWAISGLIGLGASADDVAPWLAPLGVPQGLMRPAAMATGVLDLALAAAVLSGRWPRFVFRAQLAVIAGYTAALTAADPALWGALFGPLLKNVPIAVLVMLQRVLGEER